MKATLNEITTEGKIGIISSFTGYGSIVAGKANNWMNDSTIFPEPVIHTSDTLGDYLVQGGIGGVAIGLLLAAHGWHRTKPSEHLAD